MKYLKRIDIKDENAAFGILLKAGTIVYDKANKVAYYLTRYALGLECLSSFSFKKELKAATYADYNTTSGLQSRSFIALNDAEYGDISGDFVGDEWIQILDSGCGEFVTQATSVGYSGGTYFLITPIITDACRTFTQVRIYKSNIVPLIRSYATGGNYGTDTLVLNASYGDISGEFVGDEWMQIQGGTKHLGFYQASSVVFATTEVVFYVTPTDISSSYEAVTIWPSGILPSTNYITGDDFLANDILVLNTSYGDISSNFVGDEWIKINGGVNDGTYIQATSVSYAVPTAQTYFFVTPTILIDDMTSIDIYPSGTDPRP